MTRLPVRRSTRLVGYDYSQRGACFVTIVTQGRRCLFGDVVDDAIVLAPIGEIVRNTWNVLEGAYPGVETDAFVVMPNHVHGVIVLSGVAGAMNRAPTDSASVRDAPVRRTGMSRAPAVGEVVRGFKARVTRAAGYALWQRNFYEHVVRDEPDLLRVRRYIDDNPQRWAMDRENPVNNGAGE